MREHDIKDSEKTRYLQKQAPPKPLKLRDECMWAHVGVHVCKTGRKGWREDQRKMYSVEDFICELLILSNFTKQGNLTVCEAANSKDSRKQLKIS